MRTPSFSSPRSPAAQRQAGGFTLIELMIAVAVVGLLATVAMPSLMDSIRKSRRAEAFAAISAVQQAQERWRGNNASYSSSLSEIGISNSTTPSGNYELTTTGNAAEYFVTAVGTDGSSQAKDSCRKLSVRMAAGVVTYAGCSGCARPTYTETNPCWSR